MATAGYSGTPLIKKLGITPSMKVLLINTPAEYYDWIQMDLTKQLVTKNEIPAFIHLFVTSMNEFENEMKKLKPLYKKNTSVITWVSWYKKTAKMNTDVTEDNIRRYALSNGLVDVKVCAVSELWSGLKLVVPLAKR